MASRVIIFGGAGFIGSHVADQFVKTGWEVTIVDGVLPDTGGKLDHVAHLKGKATILAQRVEHLADLKALLEASDIVIDAMAWTSHLSAIERPRYDLELNGSSHLFLLEILRQVPNRKVIYLGSRGQYGNPAVPTISEDTPMVPVDIQGINKLAAESYYRVFSNLYHIPCISLRIPNCFGERQASSGPDLGLVGSFIRDALSGKTIEVFGQERKRNVIYVTDLAETIVRLAQAPFTGFRPFNIGGRHLTIHTLAATIVQLVGTGSCVVKPIPPDIRAIDAGSAGLDDRPLREAIGPLPETEFRIALLRAIDFLRNSQGKNNV